MRETIIQCLPEAVMSILTPELELILSLMRAPQEVRKAAVSSWKTHFLQEWRSDSPQAQVPLKTLEWIPQRGLAPRTITSTWAVSTALSKLPIIQDQEWAEAPKEISQIIMVSLMTRGPLPKISMLKERASKVTLKTTILKVGIKIKEIRPQIVTKEFRTRTETKTNHPHPLADSWIQISLLHINLLDLLIQLFSVFLIQALYNVLLSLKVAHEQQAIHIEPVLLEHLHVILFVDWRLCLNL